MSLPASQQRALSQIEKTLAVDHPGLEPLFGIFTRLTGQEAMPATERVDAQPRRRRIRPGWRRRPPRPGVMTLVVLATAIGALLTLSLLLPGPRECPPGTIVPVAARTQPVSAGSQSACVTQQAQPSTTSQSGRGAP